MASRRTKQPPAALSISDIRGIAKLATRATVGVAGIAEGVHRSVWDRLGAPGGDVPGRTRGLTGLVYRSIDRVTRMVGRGVDAVLANAQPWVDPGGPRGPGRPGRDAVLAALNGVIGDRLVADDNPLAIPMSLHHRGEVLDEDAPPLEAGGKLLLLVHGLCRNESHWRAGPEGHEVDHGEALAAALDYTPVSVRYNTGLHVSTNGRELSARLEGLLAGWPTPIEELAVVAHSMGGLVTRSAIECARRDGSDWPGHLKHVVFLGTPHHGAPLERAGNWVDAVLAGTPYTAPFAKLGMLRSAGITDLRYGHVVDEDWSGRDRFARAPDHRRVVPLPEGVACHAVAATTAAGRGVLSDRLVGDGLVPVRSALGMHDDPKRVLRFAADDRLVVRGTNHMGLLASPEVTRGLLKWLEPEASTDRTRG